MFSWSYPLEVFVKGCLVVSLLFVSYFLGLVGSLFLVGVGLVLFGLSVVGRFKGRGRYRYPAVFIEVLMVVVSVGVVRYVYVVDYISFGYAVFLSALILFSVGVLGWFMSENKFVYHFVYVRLYDLDDGRRVLTSSPSWFELFLLDRIYEREVDLDRLFESMEVCFVDVNQDGGEVWLTFVDGFDVLLSDSFESRERVCELCLEEQSELVEVDGLVERFRSRDISVSSKDVVCEGCRDDLLRVLVGVGLVDETDVFVSKI